MANILDKYKELGVVSGIAPFLAQGTKNIQNQVLAEEQQKVTNEDTAAQQKVMSVDKAKTSWAVRRLPTLLTSPFGLANNANIARKTLLGQ